MPLALVFVTRANLIDYTSSQVITIPRGNVAIYNEFIYLVHATNLTDYRQIAYESRWFTSKSKNQVVNENILKQQGEEILHIIRTLEIPKRIARSIDFLGSALKFIAGTPDHEDFELLLTKESMLIENNNRQIRINSDLQNRINEITNLINTLRGNQTDWILKDEETLLCENLVRRNNHIISQLNRLALSIVLAKSNIINPLILDDEEMDQAFNSEQLPFSLSNLLLVSKVKILQSSDVIYYILKVPKVTNFCQFLKIYPVVHNNSIVKLETTLAAKCSDTFQPLENCNDTLVAKVCKPAHSDCLGQMLNNNTANCSSESAYHIPSVQKIEEGIIILNNVQPTTIFDQRKLEIRGTYLLLFRDSITINDTTYVAKREPTYIQPHPPKTVSINYLEHHTSLSLPYLHQIYIDNISRIHELKEGISVHRNLFWTIFSFPPLLLIAIAIFFIHRRNKLASNKVKTQRAVEEILARVEDGSS